MYSQADRERIVGHVCDQLAQKRPLYKVLLEDEAMPNRDTFYAWLSEDETLSDKVARARERGFEAHLEDMILIADGKLDNATEDAAIRKVRIHAREKAAQMIAPRRFGPKLDVTSAGEKLEAPKTAVITDTRMQSLLALAMDRKAKGEPIELIPHVRNPMDE